MSTKKLQDEKFEEYTILSAKNCDSGITLEFKETSLCYWLPGNTPAFMASGDKAFIPREGDIARIYGKLEAIEYTEEIEQEGGKKKTVKRKKTNTALVRGIDIIRVTEDDERGKKRVRTELFYKEEEAPQTNAPAGSQE